MNKHYIAIANGLYSISSERTGQKSGSAKIICYMMAQIAEFLHSASNDYDKESARLYFESDDFFKHCLVLAVNSTTAHHILTRPPKKEATIN